MYLLGEAEYLQSDGFKRYVKQELGKQSMHVRRWYGQDFEMAFLKIGPDSTLKDFCIKFMENNMPRQKQVLADLKKLAPQLIQRTEKRIAIKRARAKPKGLPKIPRKPGSRLDDPIVVQGSDEE
ncbi:hypothetical protein C1H76_5681 [Elsinoe australis]|uniref:Uncharacterized protein n=1 Tax=Elsinoe australis TaxID=40998 RepID=A0A4U7AUD5_9PEZI|nr:hypothetical protein C1H76_5681 [Elsinoe australis]